MGCGSSSSSKQSSSTPSKKETTVHPQKEPVVMAGVVHAEARIGHPHDRLKYYEKSEHKKVITAILQDRKSFFDEMVHKRFPTDYGFRDTSLGSQLLDVTKTWTKPGSDGISEACVQHYVPHMDGIANALMMESPGVWDKIFNGFVELPSEPRQTDRSWWGAIVSSFVNGWDMPIGEIQQVAKAELRYIEMNEEILSFGDVSLHRDEWWTMSDQEMKTAETLAKARFNATKTLPDDDPYGIDFFISHNWNDFNAKIRWETLCAVSEWFERVYGRLPRLWLDRFCIDQSRQEDIALKTKLLPATLMACKNILILQGPNYLGCVGLEPPALASLWCLVEFYTSTVMAPPDDPTRNMVFIPLFQEKNVPPPLDIIHGNVYCFSDEDKTRLLRNLSLCPGGLKVVQETMSGIWKTLFKQEYDVFEKLCESAKNGQVAAIERLLSKGAYVDLPSPDPQALSPLGTAILEYTNLGKQTAELADTIKLLKNEGAARLSALDNPKLGNATNGGKFDRALLFKVMDDLLSEEISANAFLDLARNKLSQEGAAMFLDYALWKNAKKITLGSLCGVRPDQEKLDLARQFLTGSTLILLELEVNLTYLDLSDNENMSGELQCFSRCKNLEILKTARCMKLTGSLDPLCNLKKLKLLDMCQCKRLRGGLSPQVIKFFTDIRTKHGRDSVVLTGCGRLRVQDMKAIKNSSSVLLGDMDSVIGHFGQFEPFAKLLDIDVSKSMEIGHSKNFDCRNALALLESWKASALRTLRLTCTNAEGKLESLAQCTSMETLHLASTKVQGRLDSLTANTNLKDLDLSWSTGIFGSVDRLKVCTELTDLSLCGLINFKKGDLEGGIVGNLDQLKFCLKLRSLNVSKCAVSGTLSFCSNLKDLKVLLCKDCHQLGGTVESLSGCDQLENVVLSGTKVAGHIVAFSCKEKLKTLDLRDSRVHGSVETLSSCSHIQTVVLGGCMGVCGDLGGLSKCAHVTDIFLSRTLVSGKLSSLKALKALRRLNVYMCAEMSGDFDSMEQHKSLEALNVELTAIGGSLEPLKQCTNLNNVYLGSSRCSQDEIQRFSERCPWIHVSY